MTIILFFIVMALTFIAGYLWGEQREQEKNSRFIQQFKDKMYEIEKRLRVYKYKSGEGYKDEQQIETLQEEAERIKRESAYENEYDALKKTSKYNENNKVA